VVEHLPHHAKVKGHPENWRERKMAETLNFGKPVFMKMQRPVLNQYLMKLRAVID
jgi:hypothetical protein